MKSWWETLKNHDFTEEGGYNNKRLQQVSIIVLILILRF